MKLPALKRKIKLAMQGKKQSEPVVKRRKSVSLSGICVSILVVVLLTFCIVQLLVVSVLSPRGKELKNLDYVKDSLVEENRILEQEIAEYSSLNVIKTRAEDELKMKRASKVVYLEETDARADLNK